MKAGRCDIYSHRRCLGAHTYPYTVVYVLDQVNMHAVVADTQIALILKCNTCGVSIEYVYTVRVLPILVYESHVQVFQTQCDRSTETARAGAIQARRFIHVIGCTFIWGLHACVIVVYILPSMFDRSER